jgi:hypothetical protein
MLHDKDRLIDYVLLYILLKNFHVAITGKGLQNLGLCSDLRAFEQGRMFIVQHML